MTTYNVHMYREMRVIFGGIEAETPEAAAAIARDKPTEDAADIEDCNGDNLAALIDVAGDEDYSQSVTIDFEAERTRKAAATLLAACRMVVERWETGDLAEAARMCQSAIAEAAAANITPSHGIAPAPELLEALRAFIEADAMAKECGEWKWENLEFAFELARTAIAKAEEALNIGQPAAAQAKAAAVTPGTRISGPPSRFEITSDPAESPDRVFVMVDGTFGVAIIRTEEGIVIDVFPKDWDSPIDTFTVWDDDIAGLENQDD
jgi:hypothetical protein